MPFGMDPEVLEKYAEKIAAIADMERNAADNLLRVRIGYADEFSLRHEQLEQEAIERRYERQIEAAERIGADTTAIMEAWALEYDENEKKHTEGRIKLAEMEAKQKKELALDIAGTLLGAASQAFGENKAFAVASALINAYGAYNRTQEAWPFPFAQIFGGIVLAGGLKQVSKMKKINPRGHKRGGILGGSSVEDGTLFYGTKGETVIDTTPEEARALLGGRAAIVPAEEFGGARTYNLILKTTMSGEEFRDIMTHDPAPLLDLLEEADRLGVLEA